MIYLIDDSAERPLHLMSDYPSELFVIESIQDYNSKKDELANAECIMVHKSFDNGSAVKDEVEDIAIYDNTIPYVAFSGSDTGLPMYKEVDKKVTRITSLNKPLFYEHLNDFLNYYRSNDHQLELRILIYGENFISSEIQTSVNEYLNRFVGKTGLISEQELKGIVNSEDFKSLMCRAGIPIDDVTRAQNTYESFRENFCKIVNSFVQYGKNIYTWE